MNESHRKAYLNAMGIDVYYPRVALPAAKSSPNYEFDGQGDIQRFSVGEDIRRRHFREKYEAMVFASRQRIVTESMRVGKEVGQLNPGGRGHIIGAVTEESVEETAGSPAVTDSESSSLRFATRYYRITEKLAVIEEYPPQQLDDLSKESLNLLRNILRALTIEIEPEVFTPEYFNFPPIEGLTYEIDDKTAAKQVLQGFITGRQKQDGFENLLIFAGLVDGLLIGPDNSPNRRDYKAPGSAYSITLTHSLQSMLAYPKLKKEVWGQLQTLLSRLQSTS